MKNVNEKLQELENIIDDKARERLYEEYGITSANTLIIRLAQENKIMLEALSFYAEIHPDKPSAALAVDKFRMAKKAIEEVLK